ncbi:MAG TPA: enoyl-CoA hydratase-related protein, partial [Thermoplasmata archaeon]|nr:enoyl-CoA hydratase-related protein [Thermoplasmata archaeon]
GAMAGFDVRVRDLTDAMLARGQAAVERTLDGGIARKKITAATKSEVLGRLKFTTDAAEAVRGADLVIEAVFEELAVKRQLFDDISAFVGPETLVATNTSSLSVSVLAEGFPGPERFAGLHFFYPAPINKLLEVVGGSRTTAATLDALTQFAYRLRKIPIRVKDSAGFAVNRFFVPYLNEASRMLGEGVTSIGTIEAAGRAFTGATLGPFELMNVTGTAISFHSMQSLEAAFGVAYAPAPRMEEQFRAQAPWDWKSDPVDEPAMAKVRARFEGLVFGIAAQLVAEGVATAEAVEVGAEVGLRWSTGPFALMSRLGLATAAERVQTFARAWGPAFPVAPELVERGKKGEHGWPLHYVRTEKRGVVAWVLLDRPQVMNSLSTPVLTQLEEAFQRLHDDPTVRCVVLAGASPTFCAGADIGEMAQKDAVEGRSFGRLGAAVCRAIERSPMPVIAFVEGYALGGGLEIALACDFIVASETAKVGLPEVSIGIHPGMGGASRLARLVGPGRAKYLVLLGAPVSATEAQRLGVIVRTFPSDGAREEVQSMAESIAGHAPLAVRWVKGVIDRGMDSPLDSAVQLETESAGRTFQTDDRAEGMRAFLERRRPHFEGR